MRRLPFAMLVAAVLVVGLPLATGASAQVPVLEPAARDTEPVVLTGERFPEWATLADQTAEAPHGDGKRCEAAGHQNPGQEPCTHNRYEDPDFQSSDYLKQEGVAIDRLLGYTWTSDGWKEIPFQVDEMFTRYISNNNSGFAFYSETDQHHAYAFDREGFRWTASDPNNPCLAAPASEVAPDPVKGLDTDDELVFMYSDAGGRAPGTNQLPPGMQDSYELELLDPSNPGVVRYAYVMLADPNGPKPSFDETNGYVHYERDTDANVFLYSESSYENYGAAPKGAYYDPETDTCVTDEPKQRRPGDQATITSDRYRFRYDGRWLMTGLQVSPDDTGLETGNYGPDLIDQWKARAFQQRPGGQTPCCGYEEEVNNWGGSSILMGERSGPVRTIRETWGADSGTNVVRREIFYRSEIRFGTFLRVHVIPPLDGIYAQWDYNAARVETYHNSWLSSQNRGPVAIDGQNDEVFGNSRLHVGRDGVSFDPNGEGNEIKVGNPADNCSGQGDECTDNDIDSPDPTFQGVNQGTLWEQVSGANGSLVWRTQLKQVTAGAAQSVVAVPYYRDDSCFDDGTGSNPGPHLNARDSDEKPGFDTYNGAARRCWTPADGVPANDSDPQFWQGSIGTHGVHLLFIAESDNANTTVPLTEIDSEARAVVLPGNPGNVGERYGRGPEKPLVVLSRPESRAPGETQEEKQETALEITGDTSGQTTDEATLSARLTSGGEPVAGKEIVFTLEGEEVGRADTDGNGEASVVVTLSGPARQTEQTATFAGDETHLGSTATAPFEILKDDAALALSVDRQGNAATATATLTDSDDGTGLGGRTIRFLVDGVEVATAVTDESGQATASFKAKKDERVTAVFDGDDSYNSASS